MARGTRRTTGEIRVGSFATDVARDAKQGRPPLQPKEYDMHDNANFCCPPRGGAGRRNGHNQLPKIILGVQFDDGIEVVISQVQAAA